MRFGLILLVCAITGCASVNVGTSLPIPGPIKPHVGASISTTGVKGRAGVSAGVGPVSVGAGGSTEELKFADDEKKSKKTK